MSTSSQIPLGALRLFCQQRSDMENNPSISTTEWNQYITNSYKELYDILVAAYGNDYYFQSPYQITMTANQFYNLPADFYKVLGVDLQYSASPTGWVTLKRYEFIDRNKYSYLQPAINAIAQNARIWYIPQPTSFQFNFICSTGAGSAIVTTKDVTGLTTGMSVYGSNIPSNATILSIDTTNNAFTMSANAYSTNASQLLQLWSDASTLDGISGWEEYVIIDAAIKARVKQEYDISDLLAAKADMRDRIQAMAEGRDAGQAHHVSDAMNVNSWGYNQLGAASLRYRLEGNQIMLTPVVPDDDSDYIFGGSYW